MKRYLTTPIYYVNDRPHIGHAYTTILTDALVRWHRQLGRDTKFLTGTDEHGQKVQRAAEARGVGAQQHCDELHQSFKDLWPVLHIEISDFIRTTEERHKTIVRSVLTRLHDSGLIYAKEYGGWYSVSEERFWTEKDLVDSKCPVSGNPVEWIEEKNYFFRMSNYQDALIRHIEDNPEFIQPSYRRNEVLGFLRQPLGDLCISRPKSRLSWGIELPFDTEYVTYVWFDALLNYLTGIGYPNDSDWESWWAECTHLIGKDILTTHSVYWPTMLMAMGVPLPKHIVSHGWWLFEDSKMSKSKGNVVDPLQLKDRYGVEVFRYYLLREMSVGQDSSFSEHGLITRNNTELADDLGNLLNRTLNLVEKRFEAKVPDGAAVDLEIDQPVRDAIDGLPAIVTGHLEKYEVHRAIVASMNLVRMLNKYVSDTVPFKVVKEDPQRAGAIIRLVLEGIAAAATWLRPVMPYMMDEVHRRLGVGEDGCLTTGNTVEKGDPLFPKFDFPEVETDPGDTAADDAPATETAEPAPSQEDKVSQITFADFQKLEFRVAQIILAERIEGSDKLLRIEADLGDHMRQVVAGIASNYLPDELIGKRVVLLTNLPPRKIFGVESQGMILAAHDDSNVFVLQPDGFPPPGSEVS